MRPTPTQTSARPGERGREGIEAYVNTKSVYISL